MTTTTKPLFEHIACTRCLGTGTYSFNLMHGNRCYGCGGTGYQLTRRGRTAQAYLDSLRKKPATEVKVGDLIEFEHLTSAWSTVQVTARVEAIEPDTLNGNGRFILIGTRAKTGERMEMHCVPKSEVRLGFTAEGKKALREKALAYQATLTKSGAVSKRAQDQQQQQEQAA